MLQYRPLHASGLTTHRLIAHKSVNGRYQTLMQMDQMPVLGHQMTHSIDSFITDTLLMFIQLIINT